MVEEKERKPLTTEAGKTQETTKEIIVPKTFDTEKKRINEDYVDGW